MSKPTREGILKELRKPGKKRRPARELLNSAFVGMWANRKDIGNSAAFARRLRAEIGRTRASS